MIEFVCVTNFVMAYIAYYFYKRKNGVVSAIVFTAGSVCFLCGLILLRIIFEG
jgi:hypothetical protein